jgi:beta-galactosidase
MNMVYLAGKVSVARLFVLTLFFCAITLIQAGQDVRFSDGWKFYLGDATNAQQTSFSDASWTTVCLPHTPRVELNLNSGSYYLGICWYRKSFTLPVGYLGKKLFIEFGAAMQTAQVYVNGTLLTTHTGGYSPFVLDVTNNIISGASNLIAVRLDNNPSSSFPPGQSNPDFCYFGGLYRDVTLHVCDSLHITNALFANVAGGGGIFVTYPSVSTSSATVQVKTHVFNEFTNSRTCVLVTSIVNAAGQQVATTSSTQSLNAGASYTFTQSLTVSNPQLWHPDHPNLYVVKSQVSDNTRLADTCGTTIGIRTIQFSRSGFSINGQHLQFRGVCRHQAYPYIGNAVPNSGQYRDVLRMKESGFNFVRMAHYIQAKFFVDACDKIGVLAEGCIPGWQYTSTATSFVNGSISDVRNMIRYYRNNPSVIVYEIVHNESGDAGSYCTAAQSAAQEEYPGNQFYSCGENTSSAIQVWSPTSQAGGRTYGAGETRPVMLSEYGDWDYGGSTSTSRVSRSQGEAAMLQQMSNHYESLSLDRGLAWLSGDALWSAYDYQNSFSAGVTLSGALDIFRIPKFSAFFYKSQRAPGDTLEPGSAKGGPMVFIASNWTSTSARPVTVFSNCDQVSLYLNNTLVATQSPVTGTNLEHPKFSFNVSAFQSGTLRADGLIGGTVRATHSVTTPGTATRIVVSIDTADMPLAADGSDIAIVYASILDANGTVVPTASNSVTFTLSGPADFIGNNPQPADAGIATILLRSRTTGGLITVSASATGLTGGSVSVTSATGPTTVSMPYWQSAMNSPRRANPSVAQIGTRVFVNIPKDISGNSATSVFALFDMRGREMMRWNLETGNHSLNIKGLPKGVYAGKINGTVLIAGKIIR